MAVCQSEHISLVKEVHAAAMMEAAQGIAYRKVTKEAA